MHKTHIHTHTCKHVVGKQPLIIGGDFALERAQPAQKKQKYAKMDGMDIGRKRRKRKRKKNIRECVRERKRQRKKEQAMCDEKEM